MNAIRSALIWTALVLLILFWLPLLAVIRIFDRDPVRYRTGRWLRNLGRTMTKVNPAWKIHVHGPLPEDPRLPYVVVSNHQSNADIPVISVLPWEMKWVGKAELFRIPVAGWMMRLAGDIPVDRSDPGSRATVLDRAKFYLRQHCSVIFFPEGTRSRDGRVKEFHDGAFRLAIETGLPVLPVVVEGTQDALPKHGWKFGPTSHVHVSVLAPVETSGLTREDIPALRRRVRGLIVEEVARLRGASPVDVDPLAGTVEEKAKTGGEG
jgi:1-acyl-sn-glycerol-3-phosphate acyltransferase